jgi:general secretion pathway protein C
MNPRPTPILLHLLGAAIASAIAAYWVMRLISAPPSAPPVPVAQVVTRDPDVRLAARLMGDPNSGDVSGSMNIQVSGVFAAGKDSSAVISVDGKPARAFLVGQDIAAETKLVEVRTDGITVERDGARSQYAVPLPVIAQSTAPTSTFYRDGSSLTAPAQDPAPARPGTGGHNMINAPSPAGMPAPPGRAGRDDPAGTGRGPGGFPGTPGGPPAPPPAPATSTGANTDR